MSNTNQIVLTLKPDQDTMELMGTMLRALSYITTKLDNIEAAMQTSGTPFDAVSAPVVEAPKQVETDTTKEEKPQAVEAAPVAEVVEPEQEEPEAPVVTVAELQRKIIELCSAGKKAEVRAVVNDYAAKASDIPENKRAEAMARLTALEG